jgi:hypothetical protein
MSPVVGKSRPGPLVIPGILRIWKSRQNSEVPGLDADKITENIASCPYVADKKPISGK